MEGGGCDRISNLRHRPAIWLEDTRKISVFFIFLIILSGVRLSPHRTAATIGLLYQPQMMDDGGCGAIGGMKIGRGNRITWRKPVPVPLCHHKSHMTRARTRAFAVVSQRLAD
jgi:hypothetical protein